MSRIYALDNAKFLMLILVVFGHLIEPLTNSSNMIKVLFMSIYSFHMPVLIMAAGMVSSSELSKGRVVKLLRSIALPLLVFTALYEACVFAARGTPSGYSVSLQPYWILWFLFSLLIWRLLLPMLLKLRHPLILSVALSLAAGYMDGIGYFLGLSRTIYFFPFFLAGNIVTTAFLRDSKTRHIPKQVWLAVLLLNTFVVWVLQDQSQSWLYGSFSYAQLGADGWTAAASRLAVYGLSFTTSVAVLMLVPTRASVISVLGSNSLYAYLWHGFLVKILLGIGAIHFLASFGAVTVLLSIFFIALIATLALSSGFIAQNTERFLFAPFRQLFSSPLF
ncbi:MAG: acyltransferase family protein [Oceanococcus sp.]